MGKKDVAEEFRQQFDRAWAMIRESISGFSEVDWISAGVDYLVPARIAYHLIQTVEYYIADTPKEFAWGKRFGGDWEGMAKDRLPSREDMLSYLGEIENRMSEWLGDRDLQEENELFPHTGKTLLGHALYVLRHTMDHHGQMNYILYQSGRKKVNWH